MNIASYMEIYVHNAFFISKFINTYWYQAAPPCSVWSLPLPPGRPRNHLQEEWSITKHFHELHIKLWSRKTTSFWSAGQIKSSPQQIVRLEPMNIHSKIYFHHRAEQIPDIGGRFSSLHSWSIICYESDRRYT